MTNSTLGQLQQTIAHPQHKELVDFGIEVGKLYTDHGLPLDMAMDRLPNPKEEKLIILDGACQWFIQHKRNSGATEKAIQRQRDANRKMVEAFTEGKEMGMY